MSDLAWAATLGESLAAVAIVVGVAWRFFGERMSAQDEALRRVLSQVENGHAAPLRDDLDARFGHLLAQLRDLAGEAQATRSDLSVLGARMSQLSTEVEGVRTDVRQLRTELTSQRQTLVDHLAHH